MPDTDVATELAASHVVGRAVVLVVGHVVGLATDLVVGLAWGFAVDTAVDLAVGLALGVFRGNFREDLAMGCHHKSDGDIREHNHGTARGRR